MIRPGVVPLGGETDSHELPLVTLAVYAIPGTASKLLAAVPVSAVSVAATGLPPLAWDSDRLETPAAIGLPKNGVATRTSRMRLLVTSAMYKLPAESIATPSGKLSDALAARPPSPENPKLPSPATVVIVPFDTFRTTLSAI